ncbi:DASH family cryptochrome [Robiginitalea marina]|uniref:Cryptochrome DASH n=1 Tax=Robiginitalea marina TaxID=2954105 RepID=A0ABT1AYX2_9FLAO|nr:DASH family cryptochrome [Robiginitalea marina]MCO5724837.1 DASH family cryptochrome [Robiginitalea marina]
MKTALHWFRNDLRCADNTSLTHACKAERVLALYCFDPRFFEKDPYGFPRTGKFRAAFLRETVEALSRELRGLNIPLFICPGRPEEAIPDLVTRFGISEIHAQREWTRDEARINARVIRSLPPGVAFREHYDQFLFHPEDTPYTDFGRVPEVFTTFRKACEKEAAVRPCLPLPQKRPDAHWVEPESDLPGLEALGLEVPERDPRSAFPFRGGSTAAWERLDQYFWKTKRLSYYKKTRNGMVGTEYSSKFSPWLANGSLSARQIYEQVKRYEKEVVRNQDTYWLVFELIWRDYFKFISLKHGNRIFHPGGIREQGESHGLSDQWLRAWTLGQTPDAFVNAHMTELRHTGWMSNRGRQNTASYWAKALGQDWRAGAAYFESMLLDYDVHSNWGNWMYNSGVGNDPRDRTFNTALQASRYDPNGAFRRLWLQPALF